MTEGVLNQSPLTHPEIPPADPGKPAPGLQKPVLPSEPDPNNTETLVFFNVAEKRKIKGGGLVGPQIKVSAPQEATLPSANHGSFIRRFKWVLIGLGVILVGAGVYIAVTKLFSNPPPENFLVNQDPNAAMPGNNTPPDDEVPDEELPSQLPAEWLSKYFGADKCAVTQKQSCGDDADPENDGLTNLQEFLAKKGDITADPNNRDSDGDGISDGDEVHVFGSDPLDIHTAGDTAYTDADFIKGGYDFSNPDTKYSSAQFALFRKKMEDQGLHQPTVTTVTAQILEDLYGYTYQEPARTGETEAPKEEPDEKKSAPINVDQSPEAKQDRDTQRSVTMKNISVLLIKYYDDRGLYPATSDFQTMVDDLKPYNRVATNPVDPINRDEYVYAYAVSEDKTDFVLTFYSETQNQLIKIRSADGKKYKTADAAAQFDDQRKTDLDMIRGALLLYSNSNVGGTEEYVFPTTDKYKTSLVPDFLSSLPKDPKTDNDYSYQVSETFDTFTIKAQLDAPPSGTSGYVCNQDECRYY